ncbi:MAG: hypothetical protein COX51_01380 [Syntrophobacteraceae bacterium CG23_combo_of_CG06-09_8_20_14_all_50_8]|nr:MAG: hypothetical protein COX51_01380 [Syntrophobacteraceae bacterium CG23_combo_of_CG06-09_8_20_14_all_50_8]
MKKLSALVLCLLLTGCGASKPVPDWLNTSYNQLENYQKNYLSGTEKIAVVQFKGAINEIKKSGDLEILSKAYLIRMALQTATLENVNDDEYLKIDALQPSLPNRSFFAFLKGEINQVDDSLLPQHYRGFCKALRQSAGAESLQEIEKMEDPLSQLIALGIIVRLRQDNEDVLKKAIDVASAQGWKKPLLVYLDRLQSYYEGKKDTDKATGIQQRIKLIRD